MLLMMQALCLNNLRNSMLEVVEIAQESAMHHGSGQPILLTLVAIALVLVVACMLLIAVAPKA